MSGLFEHHERNQFEIIAFSFGTAPEDAFRIKLKMLFDQFIDIHSMSDSEG
jgi:predicted O-linked N-acetylglucosamine transferase (SPINDLY family)